MKRPANIRTPPRDWLEILQASYPFLINRGIGDILLFGSQAISVYLTNPLRSKDLDLVSSQIGPNHLDALARHLAENLEVRGTTVQKKPRATMTIYAIELRIGGRPFFVEIFDKILDGQQPSLLTPHAQLVRKWNLNLWVPSPNAVVALRLAFRQPEGISRLNAIRLNGFIKKNRTRLDFYKIKTMIHEWEMESTVKANLRELNRIHNLRILNQQLLYPKEEIDRDKMRRARSSS